MGKTCECKGPCTNKLYRRNDPRTVEICLRCSKCDYGPSQTISALNKNHRLVNIHSMCTSCAEYHKKKCDCVGQCSNATADANTLVDIYLICRVCEKGPILGGKHPVGDHLSAYIYSTCTDCEARASDEQGPGK